MQTAKQKLKRAAPWLFLLLVLAGLAAVRGLAANYEIGYEIMNGDFQNYNPVRHLLAGQVPYRDFTVYLGAGELYSVGGLLLVLGNSFGRSMFATNFCTWFYFELLVLAVCLVVIGTARAARAAALALCSVFFAYVQGANLPFAGQVNTLLSYAAANGNSARMMRSAALTLAVLVILLGLHFWQQDTSRRLLAPAVLVPFAAGFLCLGAMIWAALPIFPLRWGMGCISSGCIAVPSVKLWCRHCATSLPVWWGLVFRCCSSAGGTRWPGCVRPAEPALTRLGITAIPSATGCAAWQTCTGQARQCSALRRHWRLPSVFLSAAANVLLCWRPGALP